MVPSIFLLLLLLLTTTTTATATILLHANTTLQSHPNATFTLGFHTFPSSPTTPHLAIWYTSLPTLTLVWVFNPSSTSLLSISPSNHLTTTLPSSSSSLLLLDSGNLLLLSPSTSSTPLFQSFLHPSDTWLPGMNLSSSTPLTNGPFSLLLSSSPLSSSFLLLFNRSVPYWSSGNWTGSSFSNVPEMTVPYIYSFHFLHPFSPSASFGFSVDDPSSPFTRFHLDSTGVLRQYTWSAQTQNWNTFWARPESPCRVYGLCGPNGVCFDDQCHCPDGFEPVDGFRWSDGDYTGGCRRVGVGGCAESDGFVEVGVVSFDGGYAKTESVRGGGRRGCQGGCLRNCSCVGVVYNERSGMCKYLFGELVNLRNLSSDSTLGLDDEVLYLRVGRDGLLSKRKNQNAVLIGVVFGLVMVLGLVGLGLLLIVRRKRRRRREEEEEEAGLAATHLRVFSYKELHNSTRGFSEKLGHGGFGTVFRGTLQDSSLVAVKRLERPGNGGEKEFRAEVCTIGNVQHVNLVRLRGFCSENSHRLLVYDYMPNGPLSGYLKKDGLNMSWEVRFRVAIGTARALAYLHEECRDCIIHCDIKPENILLDRDYTAKVSDFGLAKLIGRDFSRVLATMRGTWGYVAPEWISGVAITTKADVYSFGMTMLELMGGRRNVEAPPPSPANSGGGGDNGGEKWFFPPWAARRIIDGKVGEVVDPRLGVAYHRGEAERLGMVAVWCIQDEEMARPTMGMVVKMLEGVIEVGVPPPPKLLQALVSGDSFPGVDSGNGVLTGGVGGEGNGGGFCNDHNVRGRASVDIVSSHAPGNISPLVTNASV